MIGFNQTAMGDLRRRAPAVQRGFGGRALPGLVCGVLLALIAASALPTGAHEERPAALRDVAFEQRLNAQLPPELPFRDTSGKDVRLSNYFGRRPIILTMVYYRCQDLCPLVLDGLVRTLRAISFDVGREFDVLTVSFDPSDTAALATAEKKDFIGRYGRPGAARGWHFLTGREQSIRSLTEAAGFRYNYEGERDRFGHAAGIVVLTPEGKISRVFYGIEFSPRDLRLALVEASADKIGSAVDQLLLFCYHYDPTTGKYGLLVNNVLRIAGGATVLALGAFVVAMLRRERAGSAGAGRSA